MVGVGDDKRRIGFILGYGEDLICRQGLRQTERREKSVVFKEPKSEEFFYQGWSDIRTGLPLVGREVLCYSSERIT